MSFSLVSVTLDLLLFSVDSSNSKAGKTGGGSVEESCVCGNHFPSNEILQISIEAFVNILCIYSLDEFKFTKHNPYLQIPKQNPSKYKTYFKQTSIDKQFRFPACSSLRCSMSPRPWRSATWPPEVENPSVPVEEPTAPIVQHSVYSFWWSLAQFAYFDVWVL